METFVQGQCMKMCPDKEVKFREKHKLLHVLEMVPGTETLEYPKADENRIVKAFSRSAAGRPMQRKHELRPAGVLLQTVNYLLHDVITEERLPWHIIYDFVMDRLRAIRQDMVIQNISKADSIVILQPIIRFHTYAAYRLCTKDINAFDSVINTTHLKECLKKLLSFYDDTDELYTKISQKTGTELYSLCLLDYRPQFEALYIVLNLGNETALRRAVSLSKVWRTDLVQLCIMLSIHCLNRNFVRACRIMVGLPGLVAALASLHLPELRKIAFQVMSTAYNSKILYFASEDLAKLLLYDSVDDLINDCEHFEISVTNKGVQFNKASFLDAQLPVKSQCASLNYVKSLESGPTKDSGKRESSIKGSLKKDSDRNNCGQLRQHNLGGHLLIGILHSVREPLAEYQERNGIPRNEIYCFIPLITSLAQNAYTVTISILMMLTSFIPMLDGFLLGIRFTLDKMIDILETEDTKDKVMKGLIFVGQLAAILMLTFLIMSLIIMPVFQLTLRLFGKVWGIVWSRS